MKSKTTLQRKLPALVQLPAGTVNIIVTGHSDASELTIDFRSMLGSQLLKADPRLSITGQRGDSTISCAITAFDHPASTTSTRPGVQTGKTTAKPITYTRVTGLMRVSFQAKSRSGKTIGSDKYSGQVRRRVRHFWKLVEQWYHRRLQERRKQDQRRQE